VESKVDFPEGFIIFFSPAFKLVNVIRSFVFIGDNHRFFSPIGEFPGNGFSRVLEDNDVTNNGEPNVISLEVSPHKGLPRLVVRSI